MLHCNVSTEVIGRANYLILSVLGYGQTGKVWRLDDYPPELTVDSFARAIAYVI
ncbi:hypothetical protein [Komarekiella delphini-convector]|uniref:hypothetical protein n=1 Tax=Komarekiella delphini-convector TaxID=3050158 RepID=UPI00177DE9F5|nr:hypothetical protein [Komarekiella delphini-convector]